MLSSKLVKKDAITDVFDVVKDAGTFRQNYGLVYEGYLKVVTTGEQTFSMMFKR